jgi:hypothetical protein
MFLARAISVRFVLMGLVGPLLLAWTTQSRAAQDVTISLPTTFASLDGGLKDDDGQADGTLTINGDLKIAKGGSIICLDINTDGPDACPIKILVRGDLIMEADSAILAENTSKGGQGGEILVKVEGRLVLCGARSASANCLGGFPGDKGAIISSNGSSRADRVSAAGTINLVAGEDLILEEGTEVRAIARPQGGAIITDSEENTTIGGAVVSRGTSADGRGGVIAMDARCELTVEKTGSIKSVGQDRGADKVHLGGGCTVRIDGYVASLGSGHKAPQNNLCRGGKTTKPANSTACIEVLSGDRLVIRTTSTERGVVDANSGLSGAGGIAWIDLFAGGDITIFNFSQFSSPSVRANHFFTNGRAGLITLKSREGEVDFVTEGGTAEDFIQATADQAGGRGGTITLEAGAKAKDLNEGVHVGAGLVRATGAKQGGTVALKAHNGSVSGFKAAILDAGGERPGIVTLEACRRVLFNGRTIPDPPTEVKLDACGGNPKIPVKLP